MEAPEKVIMGSNTSNTKQQKQQQQDHTQILKGKRTKRQRPQSPIPFLITLPPPSSSPYPHDDDCGTGSSPASSDGEFPVAAGTTEEEEDMANCLILLAQGRSRDSPIRPKRLFEDDDVFYKAPGRRYRDVNATAAAGKLGGSNEYECKTCNRTFPSFQALGGHRASHKKPKLAAAAAAAAAEEERRQRMALSDEEEGQFKSVNSPPTLSLQLNSGGKPLSSPIINRSNKSHECSICGAEFTSGQALGGHMRRHRGPVNTCIAATAASNAAATVAATANTTLSLSPMVTLDAKMTNEKSEGGCIGGGELLSLDLNLPAAAVEDENSRRESKFALAPKQEEKERQQPQPQPQQQHLVFPAPTLVDCHY